MTGDILVAEKKDSGEGGTAQVFIAGNPTGWRQDASFWFGLIYTLA